MSDEAVIDDQSHYEISLTAGQAFVAFVFLLLSLAAAFAFGLLIGKGQADERLVVRKEPSIITEASAAPKKNPGKIVEIGVSNDDFKPAPPAVSPAPAAATIVPVAQTATGAPAYAQLLSTSDQKTAEALAAKLIDGGFNTAYVERTTTDKGPVFRVRVKFSSENEARAAEAKLKAFSKEVWITK
jgi:cell division septation protein DedD